MIELHVPGEAMQHIARFLLAAGQGATLHRLERQGETILFLRKSMQPDIKLLQNLLLGKPGRSERSPVLRLVHGGVDRRSTRKQELEDRVPGLFSSEAAQVLARRTSTSGDPSPGSPAA